MSVSVIIPTLITSLKQIDMTVTCIEKARRSPVPFELVIVETESDYLLDYADVYIYEKKKSTCTKSINRGFRCATGDMVALLTNDVYLEPNWLQCLLDCFEKEDCGLSTLASTQFKHMKSPSIEEGLWFSVAMMRKEDACLDENFVNSWDDSDVIQRVYERDQKMYRNFNSVADHLIGATHYEQKDHADNFHKNEDYFREKYKDCKNKRMFDILTKGTVI